MVNAINDDALTALVQRHPAMFARTNLGRCDLVPGWTDTAERLCSDIEAELAGVEGHNFTITQIKEKFAALRVYFGGVPWNSPTGQRIDSLIKAAAEHSGKTCQWCGKPGSPHEHGTYWFTLCDPCNEQAKKGRRAP